MWPCNHALYCQNLTIDIANRSLNYYPGILTVTNKYKYENSPIIFISISFEVTDNEYIYNGLKLVCVL